MYIYLHEAGGARRVVYLNRGKGGPVSAAIRLFVMLTSIFPLYGEREE